MASTEIDLPPSTSETFAHSQEEEAENKLFHAAGKQANGPIRDEEKSLSAPTLTAEESPIVYHYLTFETELPSPSTLSLSNPNASPAPGPPDLRNYVSPFTWSESRKNFTTWLSCAVTVVTAYTAGSYSPASAQLSAEWGVSRVAIYVGITTFATGFAIAPMVLAPFSEINGRKPVFVATGILFVICQLCCAVTRSYPGMLLARFFAGVGGSTFSTMVGGVVSDIYRAEDRNTAMALFSGAALFGTGLGPMVSGFIAQHTTWRWIFYVQTIDCGLLILAVALFMRETRGSVLLSRKAQILNKWYEAREKAGYTGFQMPVNGDGYKTESQRIRWKVKADEERESLAKMIGISLYRPFRKSHSSSFAVKVVNDNADLLSTEPVVFFFSLWIAFSWAVLYLTFSAIPLVFSTNHHFNIEQNGAVFAGTPHSFQLSCAKDLTLTSSHVRRCRSLNNSKYLSGEDRKTLWKAFVNSGGAPVLCLY